MARAKIISLKSKITACSICRRRILKGREHFAWYGRYRKVIGRCCSEACAEKFIRFWQKYQNDKGEVRECARCGGTGWISIACHICGGDPHEYYGDDDECLECGAKGWIEKECPVCEGKGEAREALFELSDYER